MEVASLVGLGFRGLGLGFPFGWYGLPFPLVVKECARRVLHAPPHAHLREVGV